MTDFVVVVDLTLVADSVNTFLPLVLANAATSLRDEPGCRQFDVCADPGDPCTLLLYEVYDDEHAFAAHLASPHFLDFDRATKAMVLAKAVRKLIRRN